jgi:hypothetical protein
MLHNMNHAVPLERKKLAVLPLGRKSGSINRLKNGSATITANAAEMVAQPKSAGGTGQTASSQRMRASGSRDLHHTLFLRNGEEERDRAS